MFNIGPWELMLILLVALIVVGPGKLPEVAKSIGKGINEFKKVTTGYKKEFQDAMDSMETTVKPDAKIAPEIKQAGSIAEMADKFDAAVANPGDKNQADPGTKPSEAEPKGGAEPSNPE